jgi:hypothetical protein
LSGVEGNFKFAFRDFVFDLPNIVATHETLWGEIQLEAFGARQVKMSTIVL